MAGKQIQKIKCPSCGKEHDFTTYSSINTAVDPRLKDKVKDGSLFRTTCPHCGQQIDVIYPCLYHQMQDRHMIYYAPGQEAMKEAESAFREGISETGNSAKDGSDTLADLGYVSRVVGSLYDLQEKIAIFDAGLDDRVVEICKVLMGSELQEVQPDAVFDDLLFYSTPDAGNRLALMREGTMFASVSLPQDVYREVQDKYMPLLKESTKDTVIDMQWVVNTVNKMIT